MLDWLSDGLKMFVLLVCSVVLVACGGGGENSDGSTLFPDPINAVFAVKDPQRGEEPWVTDGTVEATRFLQSINLAGHTTPLDYAKIGDVVYVAVTKGRDLPALEIYRLDGPRVELLTRFDIDNIEVGANFSIDELVAVGQQLYVVSENGIWVSDGQTNQTTKVSEHDGSDFNAAGDRIYYRRIGEDGADQLWQIDSSGNSTQIAADLILERYFVSGSQVFTTGRFDSSSNASLFKVEEDGSLSELNTFGGRSGISNFHRDYLSVDGVLYFYGFDQTTGWEIWRTDGTPEGTFMLPEIIAGFSSSVVSGFPAPELEELNGQLYFATGSGVINGGLYRLEERAEGLEWNNLISTLPNYDDLRAIGFPESLGDSMTFSMREPGTGAEPWSYDSSSGEFEQLMDIREGVSSSNPFFQRIKFGNQLFFTARNENIVSEIWRTDGTSNGTQLLKDINARGPSPSLGLAGSDRFYFFASDGTDRGYELWSSEGIEETTRILADLNQTTNASTRVEDEFVVTSDRIYFTASSRRSHFDNSSDEDLFAIRRVSPRGITKLVVNPRRPSNVRSVTQAERGVYFFADDGVHGRELWYSNGTQRGTRMVIDISPPEASTGVRSMSYSNGKLFMRLAFLNSEGVRSDALWVTDGSSEGTKQLVDFDGFRFSEALFTHDGVAYFPIEEGDTGVELWVSDGTAENTRLLKDIAPGIDSGLPSDCEGSLFGSSYCDFVAFKGSVYFKATQGSEVGLWKTDGTEGGTEQVSILNEQVGFGDFSGALAATSDRLVYLDDVDTLFNQQLWATDGTQDGRVLLTNFLDGDLPELPDEPDGETTASISADRYRVSDLVSEGGFAYFIVNVRPSRCGDNSPFNCTNYNEVWRTDGTREGTFRLLQVDSANSDLIYINSENGLVYYRLRNRETSEHSFWRTDGTVEGSFFIVDRR